MPVHLSSQILELQVYKWYSLLRSTVTVYGHDPLWVVWMPGERVPLELCIPSHSMRPPHGLAIGVSSGVYDLLHEGALSGFISLRFGMVPLLEPSPWPRSFPVGYNVGPQTDLRCYPLGGPGYFSLAPELPAVMIHV